LTLERISNPVIGSGMRSLVLAVLACLVPVLPAVAVEITFLPPPTPDSYFESQATQLQPGALEDRFTLSTLPVSTTTEAAMDGDTATSNWTMSNAGLAVDLLHVASGLDNSLASTRAELFFTVDADVAYSFSGDYSMVGAARSMQLRAWLWDMDAGVDIYNESHWSIATNGESFALGTPGGDLFDTLTGSQQGTLLAGVRYRLILDAFLSGAATGQASAVGDISMTLVPEPGTGLLIALGLCLAVAGRRGRL
jgi:hypothetical protein